MQSRSSHGRSTLATPRTYRGSSKHSSSHSQRSMPCPRRTCLTPVTLLRAAVDPFNRATTDTMASSVQTQNATLMHLATVIHAMSATIRNAAREQRAGLNMHFDEICATRARGQAAYPRAGAKTSVGPLDSPRASCSQPALATLTESDEDVEGVRSVHESDVRALISSRCLFQCRAS